MSFQRVSDYLFGGTPEWFDKNEPCQFLADGQASIAHLADAIGLRGQKPNDLMFAKPKLAETDLHVMRCTELFDSHSHTVIVGGGESY